MKVFIVYKNAAYGHGVHACELSIQDAAIRAIQLANRDVDSYHMWEVYEVPIGVIAPGCGLAYDGYMDGAPLFSVRKGEPGLWRKDHQPT